MTDTYTSGTFLHEIDLFTKVETALLNAGWSAHATLIDGYDKVFYSAGEDGYAINYLRVAAQQGDDYHENIGFRQRRDDDGYTGFLNFFTYQYFPSWGTSAADGYGEAGTFGPIMYLARDTAIGNVSRVNMATSTSIDSRIVQLKESIGYWQNTDSFVGTSKFEGQRLLYVSGLHSEVVAGTIKQFDMTTCTLGDSLVRPPGTNALTLLSGITTLPGDSDHYYMLVLRGDTSYAHLRAFVYKFNYNDEVVSARYTSTPPFATYSYGGKSVGYKNFFYVIQGNGTDGFFRYDILTDTWLNLSVTNGVTAIAGIGLTFVTRQQTGLPTHRAYLIAGAVHRYINIEDDGSVIDAAWTSIAAPTVSSGVTHPGYEWDGYNGIYTQPIATVGQQDFYRYNINSNTWTTIAATFFPYDVTSNAYITLSMHYGKQSRVRALSGLGQKYWIFANKDRLITITKDAGGFYSYCYAGTIDTYSDTATKATTTSGVTAGSAVVIPVSDTTVFTIGETVQIQGVAPTDYFTVTGLDNRTRQFIRTEHIEVSAINPGVSITATILNGNYSSGSLLATDIQNTMISVEGTRYAQGLNKPNISNLFASGDPVEQTYNCEPAVGENSLNSMDLSPRTNDFRAWPFVVYGDGTTTYSGKDIRGQLSGVLSIGEGSGISEDIIELNGQQYIIFRIARKSEAPIHVFGPIV